MAPSTSAPLLRELLDIPGRSGLRQLAYALAPPNRGLVGRLASRLHPYGSPRSPCPAPIWRGNLQQDGGLEAAVEKLSKPGLHLHDFRHTGNTLVAQMGASTRDLMARMGHDPPQEAMIY
jgi:integrase